ncbi:hypothetical protein [Solimonas terrae]|uniref:Uncharacterized protein n=1 Tax=Solimonas terrae TaxID=1396819 RepID=A0A6M2BRB3_9GAMM|nr:hypothetical protein [Solimonas terrae]NGY04884.1 hypothetical protein [Solimonas terrae]
MAKANYFIRVIHKGREKDYFDFWRRNSTTNAAGEQLNADLVGFEVTQSGNDADDAIASVRRKHAGLQIDTQSVRVDEAA